MKRLLLLLLLLVSTAVAAPRVGTHAGYTRVVFDLPRTATASTRVASGRATVRLSVTLRAARGTLSAPGVRGYTVSGRTVTVTLAPGHGKAKANILPAKGKQAARLVIDVPTGTAAARVPATPVRSRVVTRPAGTNSPLRPRVVLDAGHGGIDPGMHSRWVTEADVTLDVARRVRRMLRGHGVDVVMSRNGNQHLSADKASDLDARSRLASNRTTSAFVSIHVNASANPGGQGIETYYFGQPLAGQGRSLAVRENGGGSLGQELTRRAANNAQNLLGDLLAQAKMSFSRQLAQKVQSRLITATGAVNRGVQTDAFYVIRNPTTAAILIEIGFGTSPVEGPRLAQAVYRERVAGAIARAILDFVHAE
ncbi:N-acetylmuramoyl-L-alanine amidase [Deinococcus sp. YIM 134068]|uniref:N-acetylmuramoyl-L-alanine amidase family protein n=1 Tax=Deinococcus lichenicola TaxID=3118910 RepID=UPI002F923440